MTDADDLSLPLIGPPDYAEIWDRVDGTHFDRKGNPISMRNYARLHNGEYSVVKQEYVANYWVSTVWLGINHSFGHGPPLIFETMVFDADAPDYRLFDYLPDDWKFEDGLPDDLPERPEVTRWQELDMDRYTTEEQALAGHAKIVQELKERIELLRRATS